MTELAIHTVASKAARTPWHVLSAIWLVVPGVVFLAAFLLYPSLQLLVVSLQDPRSGAWSLAAFDKVFA